jgi:cell division protein FtsQ
VAGFVVAVFAMAQRVLLHDQRFVLAGAASVQIEGAQHLTRGQLLPVFAGDLERNLFNVSLSDRKAELEQIPWVKHATVMRLLPDRLRISIEERTPVAFVRQGNHINLVDASGVLLDMKSGSGERSSYSFPVVTGINANDPASVREARMKIFGEFTRDLDSAGARISAKLSEVDLSNPEDVKALIPDNGAEVLVHFGEGNFLDRYNKYEAHLAEWRTQYPNLSSVDMRYERQVVLEMQPGTAVPLAGSSAAAVAPVTQAALLKHAGGPRLITAPKTPLPARHVVAVHAAPAHPTAKHPTAKAHKSQVGHR